MIGPWTGISGFHCTAQDEESACPHSQAELGVIQRGVEGYTVVPSQRTRKAPPPCCLLAFWSWNSSYSQSPKPGPSRYNAKRNSMVPPTVPPPPYGPVDPFFPRRRKFTKVSFKRNFKQRTVGQDMRKISLKQIYTDTKVNLAFLIILLCQFLLMCSFYLLVACFVWWNFSGLQFQLTEEKKAFRLDQSKSWISCQPNTANLPLPSAGSTGGAESSPEATVVVKPSTGLRTPEPESCSATQGKSCPLWGLFFLSVK